MSDLAEDLCAFKGTPPAPAKAQSISEGSLNMARSRKEAWSTTIPVFVVIWLIYKLFRVKSLYIPKLNNKRVLLN